MTNRENGTMRSGYNLLEDAQQSDDTAKSRDMSACLGHTLTLFMGVSDFIVRISAVDTVKITSNVTVCHEN